MGWLFGRLKPGWWHGLAGWTLGFALAAPGALLASQVSQYSQVWALPAELTGLAIALAAAAGFLVVKRHSWLLAAPLAFGLTFSLCLALVEGWSAQVNIVLSVGQVVVAVGAIGLTVAAVVFVLRARGRMHRWRGEYAREAGESIAHEGLFRDDGERIIVFASRGSVVLRALTIFAFLALCVAAGLWMPAVVTNPFTRIVLAFCLAYVLCLGGVHALLMLLRAVMTSPALVVNADGIVDNCSLIVTGRGLVRWSEVLEVEEYVRSPNNAITYHFLDIDVIDPRAINRRQPLWKRALALFASHRQFMGYRIPRPLLDRPAAALAAAINRYINTHAPKGSWHQTMTAEDDDDEPDDEQHIASQAIIPSP